MGDESLAQIGEGYIQSQQEKASTAETLAADEKKNDEFDVKPLGGLVCKVMNIIFSRVGWEKLEAEEEQSLSDGFIEVVRKRMPAVATWGSEISFGIVMAVIILTRISIPGKVEEYEEEYESENKGVAGSSNPGSPGRGKNLFPYKAVKKFE